MARPRTRGNPSPVFVRTAAFVVAALAATWTAAPAVAQDGSGSDPETNPGRGEYLTEGQNLTGKFTNAIIGPQLVMVYDYEVGGTPYFRSIRAPDTASSGRRYGPSIRWRAEPSEGSCFRQTG